MRPPRGGYHADTRQLPESAIEHAGPSTTTFVVFLVILAGTLLLIVLLVRFADRRTGAAPVTAPAGSVRPSAEARVIFVDTTATSATIDCAAQPNGTPLSLRVRAVQDTFVDGVSFSLLDAWAEEEQTVHIELLPGRNRAVLDDGSTRLSFELEGYGISPASFAWR